MTDLKGFWSAALAFFELPLRTPHERVLSGEDMRLKAVDDDRWLLAGSGLHFV
ncbi:hypothetical protein IB278_27370 [Variovorax sp. VRV01]|uniref:hypothetical protein n=1 Tax=Variovorax sp. VRV01 TaxID=2769259 RepID=UPI0017864A3A|nr:hypothetical protein [Variovorax sp. VRV01]MBD9667707.1 hypothetical protein [Variovorax sp. VRV01]